MSVKVEKLEKNTAKITIEVDAEKFEQAITKAYNKIKNQISLPGFRKGKVPQKMAEKAYGVESFYSDAADILMNDTYPEAYEEATKEIEIVSSPQVDIEQMERGKSFVFTAVVAVKPEVKLGEYKNVEYTAPNLKVAADEVKKELERVRELNSRRIPVEGRAAKLKDIADIDFEGFVDGKPFDGGKSEGYVLTLGSHSFIDTFEDQIVGHNIGDEFDVNVTFPEDYQAADLAGKQAVFKCKLNDLKTKELPDLDDEFAAEVSEFDTLDEYKADVKKKLEKTKADNAKDESMKEVLSKIVNAAEMEIPDLMLDSETEQNAREFAMRIEQQGIKLEQYLQMLGQSAEDFLKQLRPRALQNIKERLVLGAIVKEEKIEISEEDIDAEIKRIADAYGMDFDKAKETLTDAAKDSMKEELAIKKALEFVFENGKAVAPKKETKPKKKKSDDEVSAEKDVEEKPAKKASKSKKDNEPKEEAE